MINTVLTKRVNNGIECWSRLTVIKLAIQAASCLERNNFDVSHPPLLPSAYYSPASRFDSKLSCVANWL